MVGKKEEFWRNKQNGDFPGKYISFKKETSYLFQQTSIFGKKRFKRDFLQRKTNSWEKDLKAFFSFNKGFRCFRKYTRVMKSYKILPIFLQQKL